MVLPTDLEVVPRQLPEALRDGLVRLAGQLQLFVFFFCCMCGGWVGGGGGGLLACVDGQVVSEDGIGGRTGVVVLFCFSRMRTGTGTVCLSAACLCLFSSSFLLFSGF